jgi:hypothetical protein
VGAIINVELASRSRVKKRTILSHTAEMNVETSIVLDKGLVAQLV